MLQPSECLLDGLQDFVEEIKYRYDGKSMLRKKLLNHVVVSQYPSFTQKHQEREREREEKARHIYFNGIVIMDQTPFLFVLDNNKTYDKKGVEEMLNASDQSSLEKRQCTIQLTVFTEG